MTGIAPSASVTLEQQPRIRALRVGRGARGLKREAALGQERIRRREDARVLRLVEVQAARIIAGEQAERLERDRRIEIEEVHRLASAPAVDVLRDRQQRLDEDAVAAHTGRTTGVRHASRPAKRIHRDQDECRRRDHRHRQHAAARTIAWRMRNPKPRHRLPAMAVERARPVSPQRQREHAERRPRAARSPRQRTRPRARSIRPRQQRAARCRGAREPR